MVNGQMGRGWTNRWMSGWTDGWRDGQMDKCSFTAQQACTKALSVKSCTKYLVSIATALPKSSGVRTAWTYMNFGCPDPAPTIGNAVSSHRTTVFPFCFITTNPVRMSCSRLCMLLAVPLSPTGCALRPQVPACLHPDFTWVPGNQTWIVFYSEPSPQPRKDSFDTYPNPTRSLLQIVAGIPNT